MRIEAVRVAHLSLPMRRPMRTAIHETTHTENALVEIVADGLSGQGAALTLRPFQARATCEMIRDLAHDLVGCEVDEVAALWHSRWTRMNLTGQSGIGVLALSAIDTALWDLAAQRAGLPLHGLLGSVHRELPIYVQPGWLSYSLEELLEEALGYESEGFGFYKMRVGSSDWRRDVARVAAVREALGAGTQLMVDANQGWSRLEARAALSALDELGLYWIEEPLDVSDVEGLAALAERTTTPLAAGETVFGVAGAAPLIERGAVGVLMPDLQHCGGPTGFQRVAVQAANHHVALSNHLFTQVSVHLMMAAPNALVVELMPGWWEELFDRPLDISDGMIRAPKTTGIGFRFSELATRELSLA
jgi:mandelate racemase